MDTTSPHSQPIKVSSPNSFDVLRYFFAFSLVLVHFCTLVDVPQFWFVSGGTRVKAFFIITGFLVLYSGQHSDLRTYARKRACRILPAYTACIVLCFVLGMFLTQLPLAQFLRSADTWKYLASNLVFLNFLQPELPGVFQDNPAPAMDGSLWSMKVEVTFYLVLPILIHMLNRFRKESVLLGCYLLSVLYDIGCQMLYEHTGNHLFFLLKHQFVGLMIYFLGGSIILLYFDQLNKYYKVLFPLSALLYLLSNGSDGLLYYLEPLTFGIVIITIAYHTPWLRFLYGKSNISYGIYLYHFPIIQMLIHFGLDKYNIYLTFALALLLTLLVSTLSWIYIEKPFLDRARGIRHGKPSKRAGTDRQDGACGCACK